MSFALIILNCSKFEHKRQHQRNTWLRDFPLPIWYHVRGNPDQEEEYIFDLSEHLLTVNVPDDYLSLPKKTFSALKAIRAYYPDITHILKSDDDMLCHTSRLQKLLGTFSQFDYGGFFVEIIRDSMTNYHRRYIPDAKLEVMLKALYSNGRFYFISVKGIDHILTQKKIFWTYAMEDNVVGAALGTLPDIKRLPVTDKLIFEEY